MTVKMLKTTNYIGVKLADAIVEVPSEVGKRWCIKGIAEPVVPAVPQDEPETQEGIETHSDYEHNTAKELYDMCINADITVEARKSKKYYIEALNSQQA